MDLTIKNLMDSIAEFNRKFEIEEPGITDIQNGYGLRNKLALEELKETFESHANNDLQGVYDGLLDQLYILIGTMVYYGFTADMILDGFYEVHRSNMSKLGANGVVLRNKDGKIMKGPNYSPPQLKAILERHLQKN